MNTLENLEKLTEREKLIYFAGLIDGEGHIGCQYYGKRKRPVIQLNMTDEPIVSYFGDHFGLTCRPLNSPSRVERYINKNHKQQYQVRAECKKAHPIIAAIHPFLTVKKEAADIALAYYENDERVCHHCGSPIKADRGLKAKYCTEHCYTQAKHKRAADKRKGL